jgi:cell division septum initiation protein DivIVA
VRSADEIYNDLRSKLRDKLGYDDQEVTQLLDEFWDAVDSEARVHN